MPDASEHGKTYRHLVTGTRELPPGSAVAVLQEDREARTDTERAVRAGDQLLALFAAFPHLTRVTVYVEGQRVGVAPREAYPAPEHLTPGQSHVGDALPTRGDDGDRLVLPGASRHYRAFRYVCAACAHDVYSTSADPPACPGCGARTSEAT